MTLQPPKTKKVSQTVSQSQRDSRMSAQEAHDALAEVEAALVTHEAICPQCAGARHSQGWSLWRVCEATGRELVRAHLALQHRLFYLANKAKKETQRDTDI